MPEIRQPRRVEKKDDNTAALLLGAAAILGAVALSGSKPVDTNPPEKDIPAIQVNFG